MTPSSVTTWMRCDVGVRIDDLAAPDREIQRHVLRAVCAVAELHPVELRVDGNVGAGRVVLLGAVVHPRTAFLVGQPRPAALGRLIGGHLQRLLHGGSVLVADRRVELDDDRHRDANDLPVGELELAVDLCRRVDRSEVAVHRHRLAVAAHHRTGPGVVDAVAERLGGVEGGALAIYRTGDDLAVGIGQGDPLEPAVTDLDADRRRRQHVGCGIRRGVRQRRRRRRLGGPWDALFDFPMQAASAPGATTPTASAVRARRLFMCGGTGAKTGPGLTCS